MPIKTIVKKIKYAFSRIAITPVIYDHLAHFEDGDNLSPLVPHKSSIAGVHVKDL